MLLKLFVCDMLFIKLQNVVDPVVASYARTNLKAMRTSLHVDVGDY